MFAINARNVNHALWKGLHLLSEEGTYDDSRNGPVLVAPAPVCTVYDRPGERVLFDEVRDANPFFHLMESLWMLAGRNDTAFLTQFVPRMASFSDDGLRLNGAYGARWRPNYGEDQIAKAIHELRDNPKSRRVVVQMWERRDLGSPSKDVPCNTQIFFDASKGVLNMTLLNRSNDAIWGAYGANAVHFSVLQEYVAAFVGIPLGRLYQISNNFHIYTGRPDVDRLFKEERIPLRDAPVEDPYQTGRVSHIPMVNTPITIWERDLSTFMDDPTQPFFAEPWFRMVAHPVFQAHAQHKAGDTQGAIETAMDIGDTAWRAACVMWLQRRLTKRPQTAEVR